MHQGTVSTWLEEGMRHYSAGDPARALESWYRILEVEPQHAAALQYVSFVRQAFRLDVPKAEGTGPVPTSPAPAPSPSPSPAAPAPAAAAPAPVATPSAVPLDDDEVMPPPMPGLQKPRALTPLPTLAPALVHASSWGDLIEPAALPTVQVSATPGPQLQEGAVKNVRRFGEDYGPDVPTPFAGTPVVKLPQSGAPPLEERIVMRQSVRFDEPRTLSHPMTPAHGISLPTAPPAAPPPTPVQDVVVKQSVRFDEPRAPTPASMPASTPASTPAAPTVVTAASVAPPAPTTTTAPPPASTTSSPWDEHDGPAVAVDVDVAANSRATAFESLLKRASGASVPPMEIARPLPSAEAATLPPTPPTPAPAQPTMPAPPTTSTASMAPPTAKAPPKTEAPPPVVDECEALMTGAKELFELGDFSGSLELVEKVLKKQPTHEGARAYLKRNEQTLLKMYESKLGDMQKVPRQLVPPDEVIWMNMHHRAGFILSQVDGSLSYDDLLSVSGMDRFDTVRILADLVGNGIIG